MTRGDVTCVHMSLNIYVYLNSIEPLICHIMMMIIIIIIGAWLRNYELVLL